MTWLDIALKQAEELSKGTSHDKGIIAAGWVAALSGDKQNPWHGNSKGKRESWQVGFEAGKKYRETLRG